MALTNNPGTRRELIPASISGEGSRESSRSIARRHQASPRRGRRREEEGTAEICASNGITRPDIRDILCHTPLNRVKRARARAKNRRGFPRALTHQWNTDAPRAVEEEEEEEEEEG